MIRFLIPLLAGAAAVGCAGPALTESQEYYVGRGVSAGAIETSPMNEDQALEEYVMMVGYTIALESDRPELFKGYHFGVLRTNAVNAFAAPGGFVFVTTGALKLMENEDELAGVLAHEIAHVNLRHPEKAAAKATEKAGLSDLLGVSSKIAVALFVEPEYQDSAAKLAEGLGSVVDGLLEEIVVNGYGRESELEADAMAVDLLSREGVRYDPKALGAFVGRLPKKDRGAWSTHPDLEGRVEKISEAVHKHGGEKYKVDPSRTARFKAAVAGLKGL